MAEDNTYNNNEENGTPDLDFGDTPSRPDVPKETPSVPSAHEERHEDQRPEASRSDMNLGQDARKTVEAVGTKIESFTPKIGGGYKGEAETTPVLQWILSIIAISLFFPLGAVALYHTLKAERHFSAGNTRDGMMRAEKARQWSWVTIGLCIIFFLFFILLSIIAAL